MRVRPVWAVVGFVLPIVLPDSSGHCHMTDRKAVAWFVGTIQVGSIHDGNGDARGNEAI